MFETVQFVEERGGAEPIESVLGEYDTEREAVEVARSGKVQFAATGSEDFAWWVVRRKGASLAEFIADSKSDKEFVLDLSSGELIEVH